VPKQKTLLFSVTAKDCDFETFCTGGNGGQHRNAKKNGVRVRHRASGAVAEHRDGRDQRKNKEAAFAKLTETKEFKKWHRAQVARLIGTDLLEAIRLKENVERVVTAQMARKNLKIETYDPTPDSQV